MAPKTQNGIPVPKNTPESFVEAAQSMSTEELKAIIVESAYTADQTKRDRDEDQKYQKLKEDFKIYSDGYNELIKVHKAKSAYAIEILKSRGVVLTRDGALTALRESLGPEGSLTITAGTKTVTLAGK